ncbi:MAG: class I tRNA ligase family protein [Solirubrobacteraceae bacterium]
MTQSSQRLFLELLQAGFVEHREGAAAWCESCRALTAPEEAEDGRCHWCHATVRLVRRRQWYLRRSAFNEENHEQLSELCGWSETALEAQRTVLGRLDGVELEARGLDGSLLTVFTSNPDAVAEASFVALSPNHPEVDRWLHDESARRQLDALTGDADCSRDQEATREPFVDTETLIQVPGVATPLPLIGWSGVDAQAGPTALLGIPAVDPIHESIARRLDRAGQISWRVSESKLKVRPAARYRAADVPISHPNAQGAAIPVVHCSACGAVPVPTEQLPLPALPADADSDALGEHPDFVKCACPVCDQPADRETDMLDCRLDRAWSWIPPTVPAPDRAQNMFEHCELERWLPADRLVTGAGTGNCVLDMRVLAKASRNFHSLPALADGEPCRTAVMHGAVTYQGSPQELVDDAGADAVRFAILHAAAVRTPFAWSEATLRYSVRFLHELWAYAEPRLRHDAELAQDAQIDTSDRLRRRLCVWCDTALRKIGANLENLEMHHATRNLALMLQRIEDFEDRVTSLREVTAVDRQAIVIALRLFLQLLSPVAPHIAEELWQCGGCPGFVSTSPWPRSFAMAAPVRASQP